MNGLFYPGDDMTHRGKTQLGNLNNRHHAGSCQVSRRLSIRSAMMAVHAHQLMHDLLGYYRDDTGNPNTPFLF